MARKLRRGEMSRISGKLELKLKAFSNNFLWASKLESGDKIILPGAVLEKITSMSIGNSLPHPIIFQIRNNKKGPVSHCGVLEFSAEENAAFLPKWMMENLSLHDADVVELRLVTDVPKATALTFKPLHSSFALLPTPKQTLEYALNEFVVLTEGDTIMIKHGTTSHFLTVTQVQPKKASMPHPSVQLLDTQVKVEFEEAAHVDTKTDDTPPVVLTFGAANSATIAADRYTYFRVKVLDGTKGLKLTITASTGDPDLYVSTQTKPTLETHTWSTHTTERKAADKTRTLEIDPTHADFIVGWFFIAVHGYKAEATFTLLAEEVVAAAPSAGVATGRLDGSAVDAKQCDNCKGMIPLKSFVMHQASCLRNNWLCTICNTVMRKALQAQHIHCELCNRGLNKEDLAKHMDILHKKIACPCGKEVEPGALGAHQTTECSLRMIDCKHCSMHIQFKDQQAHEQYCGSKSTACELCGQQVAKRRMEHHMAAEHGVNPSIRPEEFGKKPAKAPDKTKPQKVDSGGASTEWGTDIVAALKASVEEADEEDWAMRQAVMASIGADEWNESTGDVGPSVKPSSSSSASARPKPPTRSLATSSGRLNKRAESKAMTVSDDDDETMIHTGNYGEGCVVDYPDLEYIPKVGSKASTSSSTNKNTTIVSGKPSSSSSVHKDLGSSTLEGSRSVGLPSLERGQSDFSDGLTEDAFLDDVSDDGAFEPADDCPCPYCHRPFASYEAMEKHLPTCDKIE